MEDLGENHEEMDDCDENHEEMGDSENLEETENLKENLRPELLELGHELTMKIPGALKEMFQLVWREMEWSYKLDHVYHAAFLNGRGNYFYCNDPKFSDRYAWANSADPDQTAPGGAVWSGSTLFAIPSASFGLITLCYSHIVQILEWLQQVFWVSEYLGNLRYIKYLPQL